MNENTEKAQNRIKRFYDLSLEVLRSREMKYALRRILLSFLTILAVITITFFVFIFFLFKCS